MLYGKKDLTGVIKDLEVGRVSWIIWVAPCNHKGLCKRETGDSKSKEKRR